MKPYDWSNFHEHIIAGTFESMSIEYASCLAGILSHFSVVYSDELNAVVAPVEGSLPLMARALSAEYSADLLGGIFDLEATDVLDGYRRSWFRVKDSDLMRELIKTLEGHRFVGSLSPLPPDA